MSFPAIRMSRDTNSDPFTTQKSGFVYGSLSYHLSISEFTIWMAFRSAKQVI